MFTGIITEVGTIKKMARSTGKLSFEIQASEVFCKEAKLGQSVAVDGVCLSITEFTKTSLCFDAIEETCLKTTIGDLRLGQSIHLENSMKFGDQIGGHMVSGHVHGKFEVVRFEDFGDFAVLTGKVSREWSKFLMPKGFISISGASLTLVDVNVKQGIFTVHLIPDTLKRTHFANLQSGDHLNFEVEQSTLTMVTTLERTLERMLPAVQKGS